MSSREVWEMWDNLPGILKEYAAVYMQDDAAILGYPGYDTSLDMTLYPWHNEKISKCVP